MKLTKLKFVDMVRKALSGKTVEELSEAIIKIVKIAGDDKQDDILSVLAGKAIDSEGMLKRVRRLCKDFEDGKYEIVWEYGEYNYPYGYYDEEIADDGGLGKEINSCIEQIFRMASLGLYKEAVKAFGLLIAMEGCYDEYSDYDAISLETLFENRLITVERKEFYACYAYCCLMHYTGGMRLEELYRVMTYYCSGLTLEYVLNAGAEKLVDEVKFFDQWIAFLEKKDAEQASKLLRDAVKQSGGIEGLAKFVMESGTRYPEAYVDLCELYMDMSEYEKAVSVAREGLDKLDVGLRTRSKVADLLLIMAEKLSNSDLQRLARIEGFISSPDLEHYISLLSLKDKSVLEKAILRMDDVYKNGVNNRAIQFSRDKTSVGTYDYYYIHFLNGDYQLIHEELAKDKQALGWSSSLKGRFIHLFIALLAGKSKSVLGVDSLVKNNFYENIAKDEFVKVLKESFRDISPEQEGIYYSWCLYEITKRIDSIVVGKQRKSYGKAAELLVAFAEVMLLRESSQGVDLLETYKAKYNRHRAFIGELNTRIKVAGLKDNVSWDV